jgi:hypothetical protein
MCYPTEQNRMEPSDKRKDHKGDAEDNGPTLPTNESGYAKIYRREMVQATNKEHLAGGASVMEAVQQIGTRVDILQS